MKSILQSGIGFIAQKRSSSDGVEPRLLHHHGIPFASSLFASDPTQSILAIATNDGRIKLFGRHNAQALLHSAQPSSTKFLQLFHNQGFLVNVTSDSNIQVWDVETKRLCDEHAFPQEITAFTALQNSPFMFVGDATGTVSVMMIEKESCRIVPTNYDIPFTNPHGNSTQACSESFVAHILPQPMAESKRVVIIFGDGLIVVWDIYDRKPLFTTGLLQSFHHETTTTKVTSACWVCPSGFKLAVGYGNGEILLWGISSVGKSPESVSRNAPIGKLNIGFKLNRTPIASLKWSGGRLYAMGASSPESENALQVVLLNEHTESRMTKLALHLPEPCSDMDVVSSCYEQGKIRQDVLLVVGKSGRVYAYDDSAIEKYLAQYPSRSSQSIPQEVMVKLPFSDSMITVSKLITNNPCLDLPDEEYVRMAKELPHIFSLDSKTKEGSAQFRGFSRVKNLYITGHANGAVTFWDISSPAFIPILSLKQQSEDDSSLSGIPVTALLFDLNLQLLISGDKIGTIRIYKLKPDQFGTDTSFFSLQGNTRKGNMIDNIKLLKINGSILCLNLSQNSRHLAVGSDQGYVSVVDIEGPTLLYQQCIESELCTGIISLQFLNCTLHGFEKNILAVSTKDSSVLALDSDTGNKLSASPVQPKKPFKALFMHILYGSDSESKQPLLMLCSEKAVYLYSFTHVAQGIKKVICKKKFQSSCFWASTFHSSSELCLLLIFTNGKIETRSLPELRLLKETLIRGFTYSSPKPNSLSNTSVCSSLGGDIVMVNGDQEIFVVSVIPDKKLFRQLESVSQIFRKDLVVPQEGLPSGGPAIPKEKKKGLFSSVINSNKPKPVLDPVETEDTRQSFKDLETIFSVTNFPAHSEAKADKNVRVDEEDELNIDDIDIDVAPERSKEQNLPAASNKQNLASKFQGLLKGKMNYMKNKNDKKEEQEEQEGKADAIDLIKRKYGFSKPAETSVARNAESKLQDNVSKLQDIDVRTAQMQDTAKSFSSLAKQMLQITEQDKR